MTNLLRVQSKLDRYICRLIDVSEYYLMGKNPPNFLEMTGVEFLLAPSVLNQSVSANWSELVGIGSQQPHRQYISSKRGDISLPGCVIDTRSDRHDLQQYLEQFEALLFRQKDTTPPILALLFGSRVIQPLILTSLTVSETQWANGYVSKATFDLTFSRIQPNKPSTKFTPDPKKQAKK